MKKMKNILNKIINQVWNLKYVTTIVITALFGISLRIMYTEFFEFNWSLDQLNSTTLSFFLLLALFRKVLSIVLEELWPHPFPLDVSDNKDVTTLLMEDKNSKHGQNSSGSSKVKPDAVELLNLSKETSNTLSNMFYTLRELQKLKESKGIGIIENKDGSLDIDVPKGMSDKEANEISNKVSSLDGKYNDHLEHYNKLLRNEKEYNSDFLARGYKKLYKHVLVTRAEVYKSK